MAEKINDGGPAFPGARHEQVRQHDGSQTWADVIYPGMSLRDWFAGQALASFVPDTPQNKAEAAYAIADAMLKAREAQS
jgi:hypothetical protein